MGASGGARTTLSREVATSLGLTYINPRSQTVTLAAGENLPHGSAMVGNKWFILLKPSPGKLIRFNNLDDLSDYSVLTFPGDGFHVGGEALIYSPEKAKLYALFNHASRITVAEVDPVTLATSDVISDTADGAGSSGALVATETHLFVATFVTPAKIVKYALSGFARIGASTFTNGEGHAASYDGSRIYVLGNSAPAWIARVDPSTANPTIEDQQAWPAGFTGGTDDGIALTGDWAYCGLEGGTPKLWKVQKSSLTNRIAVPGYGTGSFYGVFFDGEYVWACMSSSPGTILRIDPNDDSISEIQLATGEDDPNEMAFDGQGRMFITTFQSPAKVIRRPMMLQGSRHQVTLPAQVRMRQGESVSAGQFPVGLQLAQHNSIGNVTTGEDNLLTVSIPADALLGGGTGYRLRCWGTFAANANAKRVRVYLGATLIFDTGALAFNGTKWKYEALILRTGTDAQDCSVEWKSTDALKPYDLNFPTAIEDENAAITFKTTGEGVATNDIVQEGMTVEVLNS